MLMLSASWEQPVHVSLEMVVGWPTCVQTVFLRSKVWDTADRKVIVWLSQGKKREQEPERG